MYEFASSKEDGVGFSEYLFQDFNNAAAFKSGLGIGVILFREYGGVVGNFASEFGCQGLVE